MTLEKRNVALVLGTGLDTKNDPKTLQAGLLISENVFVKKTGEIQKRKGYRSLGQEVLGDIDISDGRKLGVFNEELVLVNKGGLYGYANKIKKWSFKGEIAATSVATANVVTNGFEQTSIDCAFAKGVSVYAWEDSRGGVWASGLDQESGSQIFSEIQLSASGQRPRCVAINQFIFVVYVDGTSLVARRVDAFNPESISFAVAITSAINPIEPIFDAVPFQSFIVFAYKNTGGTLSAAYLLQSILVGGPADGVPNPVTRPYPIDSCVTLFSGPANSASPTVCFAWHRAGAGTQTEILNADFTSFKSILTLDNSGVLTRNISGISYDSSLEFVLEKEPSGGAIARTISLAKVNTATNTLVSLQSNWQRSCGLASKVYRDANLTRFVVSYDSAEGFQNTFFNLKVESGQPVIEAKILATVAGGHTKKASQLPGVWKLDSSKYLIAANKKIRLVSDNISSFSILGLAKIELNHDSPIIGNPVQLGQNLHIPGGFLKAYDGVNVFEHGFHLYPEIRAATVTGAIGLGNGAYQYIAVYEWIDSKGQKHSSAPSIFKGLIVSGGPKSANVTVQTLKYTSKKENVSAVSIAIYRTTANGTLFYRVTSDVTPFFNNPAADTVTFLDTLSDSVLQAKALIYTTGGTLDNFTVPSCNVSAVFKNRLFVGGLEQETSILFSKQHVLSEGVAFSDLFLVVVGNQGGSVNALAVLDEKLVIFKRAGIFILVGDGPTDSGAQNDFLNPQQVASDVGCTEPESIVETPEGVMFKSAKGIYLLNRSLAVEYIGSKVEEFNSLNITGAVVVPNQNQVRFTTSQGTTLVYDYFFKLWSVFTNQASAACIGWVSDFVFLKSDGEALIESANFSDNGVPIKTKVATNWFQFGGVQGFQRIYSGTILGQYVGPHNLKVRVAYDFEDFFDEQFDIDPQPIVEGQVFGTSLFGSSEFGAGTGVYQFKFQPARQKCQAMRIQIEDNFVSGEPSGGFNISGVTLEIGVKRGTNKVPFGQVMGGS